jgi:hypothetical protein
MKLIFKIDPRDQYDAAIEQLRQSFPDRKFRIKDNDLGHAIGVESYLSKSNHSGCWKELDLEAMEL